MEEILDILKDKPYRIIVRPHPQQVRLRAELMEALRNKFKEADNIELQTDFSSDSTVFEADIVVTDWSGIAYEYAFTTEKPL